jgi:formate dehydrogenase assembly factor FdhD
VILAFSRPTDLAVELATKLGITLACLAQQTGLLVFSHGQRLLPTSP